jgi:tetratricopeptide (TPR) repeat protein
MTLNNLGNVLSNLGERAGAREAYEEALAIRRGLAEAEPAAFQPDVAMTLNNLGNVLRDLGERAGARAAYEESLGIYRRLAQPEPAAFEPHVAGTLNNLGSVLSALGERAGARAAYEQALQRAVAGDPSLRPRIMANLAVRLYDDGERKKGLDLAWQAVEIVETMLADARHAEVRHSFKGEIENAYRLVLCDPQLEKDSLRAHRLVEALREGEALAGFGGWHGALLEIQRAHDGALFLANLASGTVFERGDASWTNAGGELLQEVLGAEEARQDRTGRIAAAGQKLWNSLPGAVQDLLLSPPRGGIALSLDPQTGVLPLEFLTPTGKPEDFLCLKMEMPRAPGERLFRQCQERNLIGDGVGPRSLVFGNPTHPPLKDYPLLQYAEQEAVDLASRLEALGFSPALDGKAAWIAGDAHVERFLEGLAADPAIIHFAGHGGILSDEECLIFAGMDMLFSDGLLKQARRPLGCQPFVFLNSCWTGRPRARGGAFRGLPIAFLQLGAAAVVASVFPVADQRAALFAGTFYERLFAGDTVGEAMLHTRQEMYGQEINCLHWGRPVFYGNPHARLVLPKRV